MSRDARHPRAPHRGGASTESDAVPEGGVLVIDADADDADEIRDLGEVLTGAARREEDEEPGSRREEVFPLEDELEPFLAAGAGAEEGGATARVCEPGSDAEPAPAPAAAAEPEPVLTEESDWSDLPVESALHEAGLRAGWVLGRMPVTLAEARKLVATELWVLPRPEEVQLLARLGADRAPGDPVVEFARRVISLRLVAEEELGAFWNPYLLEPAALRDRADRVRELLFTLTELADAGVAGAISGVEAVDLPVLHRIRTVLAPKRSRLLAAAILGPALADLLDWAQTGELRTIVTSLTEAEAALCPGPDGDAAVAPRRPWRRTCLEAATVRSLIEDTLASAELLAAAEADSDHHDAAMRIRHQAKDHEVAYHAVRDRLQALVDAARRTRQDQEAELLAGFLSSLEESGARLSAFLPAAAGADAARIEGIVFEGFEEDEQSGEPGAVTRSLDAFFDRAVMQIDRPDANDPTAQIAKRGARARTAWRTAGLSGIVAVLAVVAWLVNFYRPPGLPDPLRFEPSDASNLIPLSETTPIGALLQARVTPLWVSETESERRMQVESLARLATERGFDAVLLINEAGAPVAQWTRGSGVELRSPDS